MLVPPARQGEPADSMFVVVDGEVAVCAKEGGTASIAGSLLSNSSPATEGGPEVDGDDVQRSRSDEMAVFGEGEEPAPAAGAAAAAAHRVSTRRPSSASHCASEGSSRDSGAGIGASGEEVELARMRRGYFGGETSVLESTYRAATLRAVTACHIMWLTRQAFAHFVRRARTGREEVEEETTGSHLSRLPFIQQLSRPASPADDPVACKDAEPFEAVGGAEEEEGAGEAASEGQAPGPHSPPGADRKVASTIAAAFGGAGEGGDGGHGAPLAPELMLLSSLFETRTFAAGEEICREGEAATTFFVITEGVVHITVRGSDGERTLLNSLRRVRAPARHRFPSAAAPPPSPVSAQSDCFGEIGLVQNTTRTATATACVATTVLTLDRRPFNKFLIVVPPLRARIASLIRYRTTNFLRTIDLFSVVSEDRRRLLGDLFQFRSYPPHTAIYRQDDLADGLSILLQGTVEVSARGKDGTSTVSRSPPTHAAVDPLPLTHPLTLFPKVFLARISPVTVLGEVALLAGSQRTATVSALREPVLVLHLAAHLFRKFVSLAPELRDYFAKIAKNRAKHSVALGASMVSVPDFGDCGHAAQCPRCRQHTLRRNLEVARLQEQVMELEGALAESQAASLRLRRQTGRLVAMVRRLAHPAPRPGKARFRSAVHRLVAARRGRAEAMPPGAGQETGGGHSDPSARGKHESDGSDLDQVVDATVQALSDEPLLPSGHAGRGEEQKVSPYAIVASHASPTGSSSRRARTLNALVPAGEEEGGARGAGTVARLEEEGGLGPGPTPDGTRATPQRTAPAGRESPPGAGLAISRRVPIVRSPTSEEGCDADGLASDPLPQQGAHQWGVLRRIAAAAASLIHRRRRAGRTYAEEEEEKEPSQRGGRGVKGPPSKAGASPKAGVDPESEAEGGAGSPLPHDQSAAPAGDNELGVNEDDQEWAPTAAPHFPPSLTPLTETTYESEGGGPLLTAARTR